MALGQQFVRLTRGAAEKGVELFVGHPQPGAVVEIGLIEPESPVVLQVHDVVEDQIGILGLAIGRQPHDLVLARIDLEAGVIGEGGIEEAQGMGKMDFLGHFETVSRPLADRRGRPFADPVHGQHHRFLER